MVEVRRSFGDAKVAADIEHGVIAKHVGKPTSTWPCQSKPGALPVAVKNSRSPAEFAHDVVAEGDRIDELGVVTAFIIADEIELGHQRRAPTGGQLDGKRNDEAAPVGAHLAQASF